VILTLNLGPCPNAGTDCLVNLSNGVQASGRLWAFAMFSRYVRPNAVMVAASGAPTNVKVAAFKNTNGNIAVVIINTGDATSGTTLSLSGATAASVQAYYMSNSVSSPSTLSGVSVSGGKISVNLPDHSVVTVVISSGGSSSPPPPPPPSSSSTSHIMTTSAPSSTHTTTAGGSGGSQTEYGQCGGIGWSGPTACSAPAACTSLNPYYSQCL
jgi:hypothetical protein